MQVQLNKDQEEAVRHSGTPLLVAAGPGSGKTKVIVERIKHLVETGLKHFCLKSRVFLPFYHMLCITSIREAFFGVYKIMIYVIVPSGYFENTSSMAFFIESMVTIL